MKTESRKVPFHVVRTTQDHLSRRGINISRRKLTDVIFQEIKLKKWLDTPIETEKTDALEEHDSVV